MALKARKAPNDIDPEMLRKLEAMVDGDILSESVNPNDTSYLDRNLYAGSLLDYTNLLDESQENSRKSFFN